MIALLLAAAATAEAPRAFVEQLYASYRNSSFSPLDRPSRIFAPGLAAAIVEDSRLAKGEVGFLDGDPLCDCQDTGGLTSKIISIRGNKDEASARVSIHFAGTSEGRDIGLKLVKTRLGWRIKDVATSNEQSLLKDLLASNRKAKKR